MRTIISVVPLLLGLALTLAPRARAEDAPPASSSPEPQAAAPAKTATPAADGPVLQDNVPARYTVVKGDTLWGISSRFLKNPWKWPDLWGINKDEVKNPHWIYPGEVLVLDLSGATPRLKLEGSADGGASRWSGFELQVSKLSPQMRGKPLAAAIPTIPAKAIDPFLLRPLIVEPQDVRSAPIIMGTTDQRVSVSAGDQAFVMGLDQQPKQSSHWQLYRRGRSFTDPDTKAFLGNEAVYIGEGDVMSLGEVSTVNITFSNREITKGDRLAQVPPLPNTPYIPRAPEKQVRGKIIAGSEQGVTEMGTYSVVVLNRGARDGLEPGHVLGLFHSDGAIPTGDGRAIPLPEQRYGLLMVFRVFDKLSYGLILASSQAAHVRDVVRNP